MYKSTPLFTSCRRNAAAFAAAGLSLLALSSVRADTYTWALSEGGTWDTSTANWTGAGSTWVNGNDAVFNAFTAASSVTLAAPVVATSLTTTGASGTGTLLLNGTTTMDVPVINTAGSAIDMFNSITGNHGLTYNSTGSPGGRLNLKAAAAYTGDTFLTGTAYINSDNVNNALPTTTTLNLATGTTFRLGKTASGGVGNSQQVAGLVSSAANAGTVAAQGSAGTYTFTINTKSGVTTAYSGTITNTTSTLNLVVTGLGTQTISGATKAYSGSTTISGGTLNLGSSLSNSTAVAVTGGTLLTSANVSFTAADLSMSSGTINVRGTGTVGTITLGASKNFTTTGGIIRIDLTTTADQIIGSGGNFSLTNTEVALNLGTGFNYASTYTVFSGFTSGALSNVSITGYDTANYVASVNNSGVLSFAAVPEPSSWALLAGGLLVTIILRSRRVSRA